MTEQHSFIASRHDARLHVHTHLSRVYAELQDFILRRAVEEIRWSRGEIRRREMADELKIKGLAETVQRAKDGISAVRRAASGLNESTTAFVKTAGEITKQIDAAHADLKFEATVLGNSSNAAPEPEQQPEKPADTPKTETAGQEVPAAKSFQPGS